MYQPKYKARQSFTVPATNGNYATERISLASPSENAPSPGLLGVTIAPEPGGAADAVAELWLLQIGGDPTDDGDYFYSGKSVTSGGEATTIPLASYPGAQIRVKSGGTSGSLVVNVAAD